MTTRLDALRFPGTLLIDPDSTNGLAHASVALAFQLTVVDRRAIRNRIGRIDEPMMQAVWTAFDSITSR